MIHNLSLVNYHLPRCWPLDQILMGLFQKPVWAWHHYIYIFVIPYCRRPYLSINPYINRPGSNSFMKFTLVLIRHIIMSLSFFVCSARAKLISMDWSFLSLINLYWFDTISMIRSTNLFRRTFQTWLSLKLFKSTIPNIHIYRPLCSDRIWHKVNF